jgi:hypothetical protein
MSAKIPNGSVAQKLPPRTLRPRRRDIAVCGRLSVGKGFFGDARFGRCGRVFDLSVRRTKPLAMMPFAKLGPDREHALEAHRRTLGFPSFGLRPSCASLHVRPFQTDRQRVVSG